MDRGDVRRLWMNNNRWCGLLRQMAEGNATVERPHEGRHDAVPLLGCHDAAMQRAY